MADRVTVTIRNDIYNGSFPASLSLSYTFNQVKQKLFRKDATLFDPDTYFFRYHGRTPDPTQTLREAGVIDNAELVMEPNSNITLKIVGDDFETPEFEAANSTTFRQIAAQFAQEIDSRPESITFLVGNQPVDPSLSLCDLNLRTPASIQAVIADEDLLSLVREHIGVKTSVSLHATDTIDTVRRQAIQTFQLDPAQLDRVYILYNGLALDNTKTLADIGIQQSQVLKVIFKVQGGTSTPL